MLQFCPALAVSLDQESESSRITINDIFWHINVIYLDDLFFWQLVHSKINETYLPDGMDGPPLASKILSRS